MSYMNRLYMATSVAVLNTNSDQGLRSKNRLFSADAADLRPISGVLISDLRGFLGGCGGGDDQRRQAEDSLRQAMYFNCWGQG